MKVWKILFSVLIGCFSILLGIMFRSAHKVTVKKHSFKTSSDTNDRLTIFFISDLHRRKVSKQLMKKVQSAHTPIDLVIIGGDLAEKGVPVKRIRQNVKRLALLGPIFYVWGNNDREVGEDTIRFIIKSVGGLVLENQSYRITSHPEWIISGADDPTSENQDIEKAVNFEGTYSYQIGVVHNPSAFEQFMSISSPSILIGGHTHGGQIRFGSFGIQPRGHFKLIGSRAELISNGFGTTFVPLRFGAPSETHLITIHYKKE